MIVTGIGQCSLDYLGLFNGYPEINTKAEALQWEEQGGGPVATALVALSRLGISTRFHGVIGDDNAGERIKHSLVLEGVNADGLLERKNAFSQRAFIAIEKDSGKRTIFWKRPSGMELKPEELNENLLENTSFLLLDGLMKDVSMFTAQKARDLNIPVMLDAGRAREGMLDIAKHCDYVVASEEFARDLGWKGNIDTLKDTAKQINNGVVSITLGKKGSVTFLRDEVINIPSFKVKVVDTTGAGDVFHGGYIFGILKGLSLKDTIQFASALAALKCAKVGGRVGIPNLNETITFLEQNSLSEIVSGLRKS